MQRKGKALLEPQVRKGPPHRRGGVPAYWESLYTTTTSSPPTWGCSGQGSCRHQPARVLPTDLGVFRHSPMSLFRRTRPPHRRGGVPFGVYAPADRTRSSPPTWGCSGNVPGVVPAAGVLPTDVGVFRGRGRCRGRRPRPPHRRGGVPSAAACSSRCSLSSPPTWGCSAAARLPDHPLGVLPTDVGVFRPSAGRPGPRGRPPHRRGGVPDHLPCAFTRSTSSPPTWGCSAGRELRVLLDGVLPTDVGVFRPVVQHPAWRPSPPHRRGGVPET